MKNRIIFLAMLAVGAAAFAQQTVQVVMPEAVNLSGGETTWLPGLIQDTLKSNLQEYLDMSTVVDAASEARVKQLQRESENSARDENMALELGKISTAKFAVFTKIRRTESGYTISVDYTDLTTGIQRATAMSKEYKTIKELYEKTGAIDEITLRLAERLNIAINPIQKQVLQYGTANSSIDDQLMLTRQYQEQNERMMKEYDELLRELSVSSDLDAVENRKRIEVEKALLAQKQESEQKRLAELETQKMQADKDAEKEAKRSAELKQKRDKLSAQAAEQAAKVRKLKMEAQSTLGQISVIESKKKALVEIRQDIEAQIEELRKQAEQDKAAKADEIHSRPSRVAERRKDGSLTKEAGQNRENEIAAYNKQRDITLQEEIESVKNSTAKLDAELLKEIRSDQEKIKKVRTVSSMGDELKVRYDAYDGEAREWYAYLSLYSEGVLLYENTFSIKYESLTGKTANTSDYMDIVDIYDSLLVRGDPILDFEIDYTVTAAADEFPSTYTFDFKRLRVKSLLTDKTIQTNVLKKNFDRTMSPAWDIRSAADMQKKAAEEQKQLATELQKQQKQQAKKDRIEAQRGYYHTFGGGGLGGAGIDFTSIDVNSGVIAVNLYLDIAWRSWLFLDIGLGMAEFGSSADNNELYSEDNSADGYSIFYGGIGLNRRLHIFNWHPAVYCLFDIGVFLNDTEEEDENGEPETESDAFFKQSVGLVLPLVGKSGKNSLDLNVCYSLYLFPTMPKFADSFSIGLRWTTHPFAW